MENKEQFIILNFDAHKPPTFTEQKGKEWIVYGTEKEWKNNYPNFLIDLYNQSAIHNAIINGKVKYIVGQGWLCDNDRLNLDQKVKVSNFINNVGNESLKELTKKIVLDKKLIGGFAVQPIWSRDKKTIVELHHIEFGNIRVSTEGDKYFYTSDWKTRNPQKNEDYQEFNPFTGEYGTEQLIYYKEYRPNLDSYPLPDYQAGINYISSDIDIATFVAANTSSGFSGGTMINLFNGQPTPEAARDIERKFKNKFTGADKAGALMLNFVDPDKQGAEVLPLVDNGQDDRYVNLNQQVKDSIFTAHAVSPILFGVQVEGGFSNNADEIRVAAEYLQNSYVQPEQDIIEDFINSILHINGLPKCLKIQDLEPIKSELPLEKIWEVLTMDEKRELAGKAPLKKEFKTEESCNCSFSSDNDESFFNAMGSIGYLDDEIEVISEEFLTYNPFTFAVDTVDTSILGLLKSNPKVSVDEISKSLDISIEEVNGRLSILKSEGLLEIVDGQPELTEEGNNEIVEEEELITVYKYVERPNVPNAKSGSRDFCRRLMAFGRNYTREQINGMRNEDNSSVWRNRGGWYHNPATNVTTPYCRHIFQARTVKLKK